MSEEQKKPVTLTPEEIAKINAEARRHRHHGGLTEPHVGYTEGLNITADSRFMDAEKARRQKPDSQEPLRG